ncbi:hypothetical protein SmJEL517_g04574 [Synchytrium microbalum]|uniref:SH3 domain-containing protein n=1 Tax=Synchytrium microbalum TaxID=1806994 RepID=A0A507BTF7_9FUNG|nr:uncharacterized protein SmJEL517_g04574 [Synchytrium microbalum]TPX32287.1 hypothetical protein SmJEL517_g04574 [Synchytrium microbalum]
MEAFRHRIGAIFRPRRHELVKETSTEEIPFATSIVDIPSIFTEPPSQQHHDISEQSESLSVSSPVSTVLDAESTSVSVSTPPSDEPPSFIDSQHIVQYRVMQPYTPREPDELALNLGDVIIVNEAFLNGWAFGYSQATNLYGMVPKAALEEVLLQAIAPRIKEAEPSNSPRMPSAASIISHKDDLSALKAWLTPVDFRLTTFTLKEKRLKSTRGWLFDELMEWKDGTDQSRLYWLSGVAGVGKSVIAGCFADELQNRSQLAGYFFCKHDENARSDPRRILGTWAFQLACFDPDVRKALLDLYQAEPNFLINTPSIGLQFEQLIAKPLSKYRGGKAVILLDALDECAVEDSKQLRGFLQPLAKHFSSLPKQILFFVTSRPLQELRLQLSEFTPRVMELEDIYNLNDIKLYAIFRVTKLRPILDTDEQVDCLADKLATMAHGLFVWLHLACDTMDKSDDFNETITELEQRTPGNDEDQMDAMYTRALVSGYKEAPGLAIELYTKLVGALIALRTPMSADDLSALLVIPSTAVKLSFSRIQSLLAVSKSSVQLMHKSAADFITSRDRCIGEASPFFIDKQVADSDFARMCLLALPPNLKLQSVPVQIERLRGIVPDDTPAHMRYVLIHWIDHLNSIEKLDSELTKVLAQVLQFNGRAMLIVAVIKNLPIALKHILKVGGGPYLLKAAEDVKFFKSTILVEAIVSDNSGIVEALLEYGGAPVEGDENYPPTPMQACVIASSVDSLMVLLRHGVDLEGRTAVGGTSEGHNYDSMSMGVINIQVGLERTRRKVKLEELHMDDIMNAARLGNVERLKHLLEVNPSIDINQQYQECGNKTLLLVSCQYGSVDVVTYLLSIGANPNLVDHQNRSSLHHACSFGSLETVKALLKAGALVDAEGLDSRDAFFNNKFVRPIDLACEKGHIDIVRWLLENDGVSSSALDPGKVHPLCYAAMGDSIEVIQLLLSHGADVNCVSTTSGGSCTAIFGAAMYGAENSVAYLLNLGADSELGSETEGVEADGVRLPNLTPLDVAWVKGYPVIVSLLLPRSPPAKDTKVELQLPYMGIWIPLVLTPLIVGTIFNEPALVKMMLDYGDNTEVVQPFGFQLDMFESTALHWAFWHGRTVIARMLLDAGANIKARVTSNRSCLHVVALSLYTGDRLKSDMIRLGKYYGADLDDVDADGCTPLLLAVTKKAIQTVETLLELGANVNLADNSGNTPLHEAAKENAANMVTVLVKGGADKSKVNKSGMTPLQIAQKAGYNNLLPVLR